MALQIQERSRRIGERQAPGETYPKREIKQEEKMKGMAGCEKTGGFEGSETRPHVDSVEKARGICRRRGKRKSGMV